MADINKDWESASPIVEGLPTTGEDKTNTRPSGKSLGRKMFDTAANIGSGALRGTAGIGSTLLWPVDKTQDAILGDRIGLPGRNEERRAKIDQFLVEEGADPKSLAFQGGRLLAEIGGTAGAGGALANTASRIPGVASAFPNLVNAVRTSGMTGGNMGTRMAGGGIAAGTQGLLADPEHAGTAFAIGAALPPALRGAGAIGNFFGRHLTKAGAQGAAVNKIGATLGDDVGQAIGDLQTYFPKGAETIPVSSAAIIGKPAIAQLEQASRIKVPAPWYDFDQKQAKAVFENVIGATKEAEEIGARAALRQSNWQEAWKKAADNQKPKIWQWGMQRFSDDIEKAMVSAEASNPQVMASLKQIKAEIERLGPAFTPSHLQQLRAELNGKSSQAANASPLKTASRDTPAIISLKHEMDSILNASTGGKWQKVLEGYSKDSASLEAARAAEKVRGRFVDRDTGRILGRTADATGEVPIITESGLGGALNLARNPNKTVALSQGAQDQLQATLDTLRRQGIVQGVKRSATAGGGSDTAANLSAIAAQAMLPGTGTSATLRLADMLRQLTASRTDREVAGLLSNPDALAKVLPRLLQQPSSKSVVSPILSRSAPLLLADPSYQMMSGLLEDRAARE